MTPAWLEALEADAPQLVTVYRALGDERFIEVRREMRRAGGAGSAERITAQLGAVATALAAVVADLPEPVFLAPGGEGDWNVAEAIGHDADARAGLATAASLAAQGRFPADAPTVVPGVPGAPTASRAELLRAISTSQKLIERAARSVAGHELDACPLDHPLLGRLRCGEWLVFAGVHDLMHLEQLHGIAAQHASR